MFVRETERRITNTPKVNANIGVSCELFEQKHPLRHEVEAFVSSGFYNAYGARIHHYLPNLLQLSVEHHKAVLGLRSAEQSLFIEQYLTAATDLLAFFPSDTRREDIVEIGNLHSSNKALTIQLLMVTAVALFMCDKKYMVFTATSQVKYMLEKTGIPLQSICIASEDCLQTSDDHWGSYYQTSPEVIAVDLSHVMQVIAHSPRYQAMFERLTQDIATLSNKLRVSI